MMGLGEEKMPPNGYPQPSTIQVSTIKAWVKSGAANSTNCSSVSCDTSAVVSYSADLQPLFSSYCNGCHGGGSPSANLDLSVFQTVKDQSLTGRIQGAMSGTPGYISMPPSGNLLSSCYVDKINKWVAAGAPNN
jgi:mono/diheme cytochrome c family protein